MREKFDRFMIGRLGADQLNILLSGIAVIMMLLSLLTGLRVFWALGLAALFWSWFRMFSKNLSRRQMENAQYMVLRGKVTGTVRNWTDRLKMRKEYAFFRCPSCHSMLRVPRGKGKLRITCRKCGNAFERRT